LADGCSLFVRYKQCGAKTRLRLLARLSAHWRSQLYRPVFLR
jgi:hypothetical protein